MFKNSFIRFCLVGALCTLIDTIIFYCVRAFASYHVAMISGYVLSLIVNYFLTIYWTFKSKPTSKNAIGIIVAHLFNLFIVRFGLMHIFVDILSLNDKLAYMPTLVISVITNFIVVKCVINKLS